MLLRHTPDTELDRSALTVNPAKTCQPIGAMYAALGIHSCLPHSHGSQGCCSYHRSQLTRHYKEPVMAATSSFTEGSSVFGGQANLLNAIQTIFSTYDPEVIAVHTTCLSETIGDDLVQIIKKAHDDGKVPEGKVILHASTPSYQGSHVTGYSSMVKAMVDQLVETVADESEKEDHLVIFPTWVDPADMRELRRIASMFDIPVTVMPDTSGVLDNGMDNEDPKVFPAGGTTVQQIRDAGKAKWALAVGPAGAGAAAGAFENKTGTTVEQLVLPLGMSATDQFVMAVHQLTGKAVPEELNWERSRLLDLMSDMEQYFHGTKVAMYGDPDQLQGLASFCTDVGMDVQYALTGTPGKVFQKRMKSVLGEDATARIEQGNTADMYRLHTWIKQDKPDLLIGNSHGKHMSRDEDLPLVRYGFPILDRIGHQYFSTLGYMGGVRFAEQILTALLDRADRDAPEESFELVM